MKFRSLVHFREEPPVPYRYDVQCVNTLGAFVEKLMLLFEKESVSMIAVETSSSVRIVSLPEIQIWHAVKVEVTDGNRVYRLSPEDLIALKVPLSLLGSGRLEIERESELVQAYLKADHLYTAVSAVYGIAYSLDSVQNIPYLTHFSEYADKEYLEYLNHDIESGGK